MNRIVLHSFLKQNTRRSQKNMNTIYSVYSYSGIVPREHALKFILDTVEFLCETTLLTVASLV